MCIWMTWVGWVLADWVNAGQTGPSRTKEMHHVSFQGFPEVSRQMGMEMSRQRAHFNLARHSWSSHYTRLFTCKHTRIHKDAHMQVQTNSYLIEKEVFSIPSFTFNNSWWLKTRKALPFEAHLIGLASGLRLISPSEENNGMRNGIHWPQLNGFNIHSIKQGPRSSPEPQFTLHSVRCPHFLGIFF